MSERDDVLNYRTGPESEIGLDDGERLIATFEPDPARYWRDHVSLAAFFGAAAMVVLLILGKPDQIVTGVLAAFAAIAAAEAARLLAPEDGDAEQPVEPCPQSIRQGVRKRRQQHTRLRVRAGEMDCSMQSYNCLAGRAT